MQIKILMPEVGRIPAVAKERGDDINRKSASPCAESGNPCAGLQTNRQHIPASVKSMTDDGSENGPDRNSK